jgi:hypothetical protein
MRGKYSRDVSNPCLILHGIYDLLGQDARDLRRIDTPHVAVQTLPLCDPGFGRVGQCDEALEDLRRAVGNSVGAALEAEELLTVWASFLEEALGEMSVEIPTRAEDEGMGELAPRRQKTYLLRLNDGADHAGTQIALLARSDEVGRHCCGD